MEKDTMIFNLSKKLEYSKGGDFAETASLEFRAPGMNEYDEIADLSQLIMGAMVSARSTASEKDIKASQENKDSQEEMTVPALRSTLLAGQAIKFKDIAACFRRLACVLGTTDGSVKITDTLLDKMSIQDFNDMLCEFCINFILSWVINFYNYTK